MRVNSEMIKSFYKNMDKNDYISNKYNIKLSYNSTHMGIFYPSGLFTPDDKINAYHCAFTDHMPRGSTKHNEFINDIKFFENDLHQKIKTQETLTKNNINSGIIKQIEDTKIEYYNNLFNENDGPRKYYYDNLYKEINDTHLNYYNIYLSEMNNQKNQCDNNISKHIELRLNKSIKFANIVYNFESHKNVSKLLSIKKHTNINLRTIKILFNSIKTGAYGPIFAEQLIIDNAIIIAHRIV